MVHIKHVFLYRVFARNNPAHTPRLRAMDSVQAAIKLEQVRCIYRYLERHWQPHTDPERILPIEIVRWAGRFLLAEHTDMELPPAWPEGWYLGGTLRRWAQDSGGYGGYLLNVLAKLIVDWPRGGVNPDDEYKKEERKKAIIFRAAFPALAALFDGYDEITAEMVSAAIEAGDLEIWHEVNEPENIISSALAKMLDNDIAFEDFADLIPEQYREQAKEIYSLAGKDFGRAVEKIVHCPKATEIALQVAEKYE